MRVDKEKSNRIYNRYLKLRYEDKLPKGKIYEIIAEEEGIGTSTVWDHTIGRIKSAGEEANLPEEPVDEKPTPIEPEITEMPSVTYKRHHKRNKTGRYILTGWELRTGISKEFIDCLNVLADELGAKLLLTPVWHKDYEYIPKILRDNFEIVIENIKFNDNLIFHYVNTSALIQSPLGGWKGAFPDKTAIIPGLIKELVTESSEKYCKQLITTGSVGYLNANYHQFDEDIRKGETKADAFHRRWKSVTNRASGKTTAIAQKYVKPSALVIDVKDDKTFLTRFVTMEEEGVIYDINKKITPKGVEHSSPSALITGDYHAYEMDESNHATNIDMIKSLDPDHVILNDFADMASACYHELNSAFKFSFAPSIKEEAEITKKVLRQITDVSNHVVYLHSNHDNFLEKYLDSDPQYHRLNNNYKICAELNEYRLKTGNHPIIHLLELDKIDNLSFSHEADILRINKNAVIHGHESYSRMGFKSFAKTYNHLVMGHCMDRSKGYKIFTKERGVINLEDAKVGETTYGYKDGKVVESKIKDTTSFNYTGEMYDLKYHNRLNQSVTSNHHMTTVKDEYIPVTEFVNRPIKDIVLNADAGINNDIDYEISDDMLRLIVATCADGSFAAKYSVRYHFKKERKIERLTSIINSLGYNIEWTAAKHVSGGVSYKSKHIDKELREQVRNIIPDKKLPKFFLDLSSRQLDVVVNELSKWDGSKYDTINGSYQFTSFDSNEIDLVMELLLRSGKLPRLVNNSTVVTWTNKFDPETNGTFSSKNINYKIRNVKNQMVDCVTTETNNFFLIGKGQVQLTGNTHNPAVFRNAVNVGATAKRYQDYSIGTNGIMAANALIHPDGAVQLLPIIPVNSRKNIWR